MKKYHQLSQSDLNDLYAKSGVLLLLQAPEGIQLGIDNISWKIGNKFKGIKLIPFGVHIISYSLKQQNNMFKISQFINFSQENRVQVYKWQDHYKMFLQLKGEQTQQYQQSVKRMHYDCYLGPYPQQNYAFWKQTTSHITKKVLEKLDPLKKINRFDEQYGKLKAKQREQLLIQVDQDEPEQIIEQYERQEMLQEEEQDKKNVKKQKQIHKIEKQVNKFQNLTDTINYSQIVRKLSGDPTQISRINIDKTQILDYIIQKQWNNDPICLLGQLQYAFVYFLIGQDLQSFQQWKKIIDLIVFSQFAYYKFQINRFLTKNNWNDSSRKTQKKQSISYQKFILQFIVVFYGQLQQFPQDFFIDEISKTNFLKQVIKRLKQYEKDQNDCISQKVKIRLRKLFKYLQSKFLILSLLQNEENQNQDLPMTVLENQTYF